MAHIIFAQEMFFPLQSTMALSAYLKKAGHTLLLHGRHICKARNPLCGKCVIFKNCFYKDKLKYV